MIEEGLLLDIQDHPATPDPHHHVTDLAPAPTVVTIIRLLLSEGNIQGMWPVTINVIFFTACSFSNDALFLELVLI